MYSILFALQRAARIQRMRRDETGATAVEYGLLIAVIALLIIGGMFLLSDSITALFTEAGNELENPTDPTP